ncbi:c1f7513f-ecb1-463c-82cd-cb85a6a3d596 [Sclerotinia trifoliorum]|uniref:C1f7513f-ecb1-463c-82cd-cb85a6a3d596 n=1 Tax=Sclerotinia trifoliorum TaxID=28548 RepID=A0A8H2VUJ1_9HELO|nr:c1f7513f-ecb1-463c-82cd-cb85a6a3d596 [Sclerotinia trifoliorum]
MPKEKSVNPAQAQRKAEKAKAIKKGKASLQAQKNERLAKKNPQRLQSQLDDFKKIESSGGKLTSHERSLIDGLEKEIKAVNKAREALGDAAPQFSHSRGGFGGDRGGRGGFGGRGGGGVLGKRRRDGGMEEESSDSDVDEEVKRIPMPRDTPPPFPKEVLDKWYAARRARYQAQNQNQNQNDERSGGTNANSTPLGGKDRGEFGDQDSGSGKKVQQEVKTVYEAKPQIRDLRKEAVAFVPAAVRAKMQKGKGEGGLMEPEEMERLEKEGYIAGSGGQKEDAGDSGQVNVEMEEVEDEDYT